MTEKRLEVIENLLTEQTELFKKLNTRLDTVDTKLGEHSDTLKSFQEEEAQEEEHVDNADLSEADSKSKGFPDVRKRNPKKFW